MTLNPLTLWQEALAGQALKNATDALPQEWNNFWSGVNSPAGQAAISQAAISQAAVGAGLVSPAIGIPSNAASTVVASAPYAAQQTFDPYRVWWSRYKNQILIGAVAVLGVATLKRSTPLAVVGMAGLGVYLYGRSKYE